MLGRRCPAFFLVCLTLITACGDDGTGLGPRGPSPADFAGEWEGTTGDNLPIYFRVTSAGVIDSLTVRIRMDLATFTCTTTFRGQTPVSISGTQFSTQVSVAITTATTTLRGTFASSTSASGNYDGYSGSFSLVCGSTFTVGTGSPIDASTWQAVKKS